MARKRTVAQRQRMGAAQKKRYGKKDASAAPEMCCPVEAIIYAKRLVDATNGNTMMAAKIVETIGSIS